VGNFAVAQYRDQIYIGSMQIPNPTKGHGNLFVALADLKRALRQHNCDTDKLHLFLSKSQRASKLPKLFFNVMQGYKYTRMPVWGFLGFVLSFAFFFIIVIIMQHLMRHVSVIRMMN